MDLINHRLHGQCQQRERSLQDIHNVVHMLPWFPDRRHSCSVQSSTGALGSDLTQTQLGLCVCLHLNLSLLLCLVVELCLSLDLTLGGSEGLCLGRALWLLLQSLKIGLGMGERLRVHLDLSLRICQALGSRLNKSLDLHQLRLVLLSSLLLGLLLRLLLSLLLLGLSLCLLLSVVGVGGLG